MSVESEPAWEATWEASRAAQAKAWAALTVDQRMEWLEGAIEIARASGALARERERRDAHTKLLWEGK